LSRQAGDALYSVVVGIGWAGGHALAVVVDGEAGAESAGSSCEVEIVEGEVEDGGGGGEGVLVVEGGGE
jgi:hypothetical protein